MVISGRSKSLVWRAVFAALVALTVSMTAQRASAQTLGRAGDFVIGAERLFGAYSTRLEVGDPGAFTNSDGGLGFLIQRRPGSILASPRIGFDYFISPSFNVGGVLAMYSAARNSSGFLFAPRVGYVLPFNAKWGFWPRGGLTYFSEQEPNRNQFGLSLEGAFYFMPAPIVGFTFSPFLELGISGTYDNGTQRDFSERAYGGAFGIFVRF